MSPSLNVTTLNMLGHLLRAQDRPVDPAFLARELGVPSQAIRQAEDELTCFDCRLEHDPRGVRLVEAGLGVWSDYLNHVQTTKPARAVEVYQRTTSTQDLAKARAGQSVLILANEQTGGRGRLGRSWHAPAGTGLLLSMTCTFTADRPGSVERVSFITAVAVAQAIEAITGHGPIQVRWPNDLVVDGRKLAGILVETVRVTGNTVPSIVIGVGINVGLEVSQLKDMPAELRPHVTSFRLQGWPADRLYVAERVVRQIDRHLTEPDLPHLVDAWRARNLYRDQTHTFLTAGRSISGTVMDLDPDHGLIVRRDTGEIVHLPAATTSVVK